MIQVLKLRKLKDSGTIRILTILPPRSAPVQTPVEPSILATASTQFVVCSMLVSRLAMIQSISCQTTRVADIGIDVGIGLTLVGDVYSVIRGNAQRKFDESIRIHGLQLLCSSRICITVAGSRSWRFGSLLSIQSKQAPAVSMPIRIYKLLREEQHLFTT